MNVIQQDGLNKKIIHNKCNIMYFTKCLMNDTLQKEQVKDKKGQSRDVLCI